MIRSSDKDRPLRVMGSSWSDAVTEAQRWAFKHGYLLKLTLDQKTELDALWEEANQDPSAFIALLEARWVIK